MSENKTNLLELFRLELDDCVRQQFNPVLTPPSSRAVGHDEGGPYQVVFVPSLGRVWVEERELRSCASHAV